MRIRMIAVGAGAALALAACSSSSSTPGSGTTTSSGTESAAAFCQQLKSAQTKLSGLSSNIGNPAQLSNKLKPVVSELQQLQNGAPPQVAPALKDLLSAAQQVAQAGSGSNVQQVVKQLQHLVPKLTKDVQHLESYVAKNCH